MDDVALLVDMDVTVLFRWAMVPLFLILSSPAVSQVEPCVNPGPRMALTFDDGPWPTHTDEILTVLSRHGVHATFFMVGERVEKAPAMARRVWEEGHEIGLHTQHHASLSKLSPEKRNLELSEDWDAIHAAVPEAHLHFWRAPYGDVPKPMPPVVQELGLVHQSWTIDTNDWRHGSDEDFLNAIFLGARDGAVVLMHDHTPLTRRNLDQVVTTLQQAGYQLVPVSLLKAPVCSVDVSETGQPSEQPLPPSLPVESERLESAPLSEPLPGEHEDSLPPSIRDVPPDQLPRIITY